MYKSMKITNQPEETSNGPYLIVHVAQNFHNNVNGKGHTWSNYMLYVDDQMAWSLKTMILNNVVCNVHAQIWSKMDQINSRETESPCVLNQT